MQDLEIGTDIVSIQRIQAAVGRHGSTFLDRIFTSAELELANILSDPAPFYAGRFAAKEAISKALGCGFGELLSWSDIEILREASGKPKAKLSPEASKRFNHPHIKISISHEKEFAVASALIIYMA